MDDFEIIPAATSVTRDASAKPLQEDDAPVNHTSEPLTPLTTGRVKVKLRRSVVSIAQQAEESCVLQHGDPQRLVWCMGGCTENHLVRCMTPFTGPRQRIGSHWTGEAGHALSVQDGH